MFLGYFFKIPTKHSMIRINGFKDDCMNEFGADNADLHIVNACKEIHWVKLEVLSIV